MYPVYCVHILSPTHPSMVLFSYSFFSSAVVFLSSPSPYVHVYKITSKYKLLPLLLIYRDQTAVTLLSVSCLVHCTAPPYSTLPLACLLILLLHYSLYFIILIYLKAKISKSNINFPKPVTHPTSNSIYSYVDWAEMNSGIFFEKMN